MANMSYAPVYRHVFDKLLDEFYEIVNETGHDIEFMDITYAKVYNLAEVEMTVKSMFTEVGGEYTILKSDWENASPSTINLIKTLYKKTYVMTFKDGRCFIDWR